MATCSPVKRKGNGTVETTELNEPGSIDAVAASLMNDPAPKPEPVDQVDEDEDAVGADDAPEADAPEDDAQDADEPEGDDTDDETDEDQEASKEQKFDVVADGKKMSVTLAQLSQDFAGQVKIQNGMQQVAAAKKQVEQVYASLQAQTQRYNELLASAQSGKGLSAPTPPDRELMTTDPFGFMEARLEFEEAEKAWKESQTAHQQHTAQQTQAMQQAQQAHLADQAAKIRESIPDFADPVKAKALQSGMSKYAAQIGYTPEEINGISDARVVSVLHDAMRYREMIAARKSADANVAPTRQAIRPGAKRSEGTTAERTSRRAAERMRQTGDIDDVAQFLIS
jgi:hypothetical protein